MARATGTQALSTTPVQLPAQPCLEVSIANNDASIVVLIGWSAATQAYSIAAGGSVVVQATNLNQLYAKSASGTPTLSYITS